MKKKTFLIIILAILTYSLVVFFGDATELLESLKQFNLLFIPLILFLTLINYLIRFFRWDYYLKKAEIKIPLKENFYIFLSGMAMGVTPGKSGELIKSYILKKNYNLPYKRTFPVVVLDRLSDVTGMVLLSIIGLSVFKRGWFIIITMVMAISLFLVVVQNKRLSGLLIKWAGKLPFIEKYIKSIKETHSVFRKLSKPSTLIAVTLISAVSWFFECLALYFTIIALNSQISLLEAVFVFSFATVVGALSMLPGGLIVAEGSMMGLLSYLRIPGSVASASTIVIRVCTLWFGVLIGFIALAKVRKIGNNKKHN